MTKKWLAILIAAVVVFVAIGCIGERPEDVIIDFMEFIDEGEYEKALDLLVHTRTMEPYTDKEKSTYVSLLKQRYGEEGEDIKILELEIKDKEKIDEDRYVITVYSKVFYDNEVHEETEDFTVVNIDGEWKIAHEIPGFSSLLAVFGLLMVYALRKRR